jgi:hypothetical protein
MVVKALIALKDSCSREVSPRISSILFVSILYSSCAQALQ